MRAKPILVIVTILNIVSILFSTSQNCVVSWISASIAILLVVYSALGELKLRNQLESTDKEFQIKRDCKGNIISHAKIDCGTY